MNDFIYVLLILYIGLVLGTFTKFLSYGLGVYITFVMTIISPIAILILQIKIAIKNLVQGQYKDALYQMKVLFLDYPVLLTIVGEVITEITARRIALKNIEIKRLEAAKIPVHEETLAQKLNNQITFFEIMLKALKTVVNDNYNKGYKYS